MHARHCLLPCNGFLALFLNLFLVGAAIPLRAAEPPLEFHRLRFFLHPDLAQTLSSAERERRLGLYVEDLNTVFSKQTIRRFAFDASRDIVITNQPPHSRSGPAVLPASGFEIWAWVQLTDQPAFGSYGGMASLHSDGTGVAEDLHWDAIHDRAALMNVPGEAPELLQYWRQVHHLTHEIEHIFGAGIGEYYRLASVEDSTGEPPLVNIGTGARDSDPYWSRHPDFWTDPLLIWTPSLSYAQLLEQVRFADVTAALLNGPFRERWTQILPDCSRTEIRVREVGSLAPLANARIRAWKVAAIPPSQSLLFDEGVSGTDGNWVLPWDPKPNNYDMTLLLKVYPADGRPPSAYWYSIFDAQEQRLVAGLDHPVITILVPPAPAEPSIPTLLIPPADLTANEGEPALLRISAAGSPRPTFIWTLDGVELTRTTEPFLAVTNVRPDVRHTWSVRAENSLGAVTSSTASLRVIPQAQVLDWRRLLSASGPGDERPGGLAVDAQGNLFCAVNSQGAVTLDGESIQVGRNGLGWLLVRYDAEGRRTWHRSPVGENAGSEARSIAVNPTTGECHVLGWMSGVFDFGGGLAPLVARSRSVFVAKYGPEGAVVWVRLFEGSGPPDPQGIAVNEGGLCAITGSFMGSMPVGRQTLTGPEGVPSFFLSVLDPAGEPRWAIASSNAPYAEGSRVVLNADGGGFVTLSLAPPAVVAGLSIPAVPFATLPLLRFDDSGGGTWVTNVPARNIPPAMASDRAGGVVLTGQSTSGRLYVSRISGSGESLWNVESQGFSNDSGRSVATDAAGRVFVAGEMFSSPLVMNGLRLRNRGANDAVVLALDAGGRALWAQSMGGSGYDAATAIAVDPKGRVHVCGSFQESATFGSGVLTSSAYGDTFLGMLGPVTSSEAPFTLTAVPDRERGELALHFPSILGRTYFLEAATNLSSPVWSLERALPGTGVPATVRVPFAVGDRFFRLRQ